MNTNAPVSDSLAKAQNVLGKQRRAVVRYAERDENLVALSQRMDSVTDVQSAWTLVWDLNKLLYPHMMWEMQSVIAQILRFDSSMVQDRVVWAAIQVFHNMSLEDKLRHGGEAVYPRVYLHPDLKPESQYSDLGKVVSILDSRLWELRPILWSLRDDANAERNRKAAERETTVLGAMLPAVAPCGMTPKPTPAQSRTQRPLRRGEQSRDWKEEDKKRAKAYQRNLAKIAERRARNEA